VAEVLAVDRLCKQFGGLRAVADASLQVGEGEIVSLIGPNGAGKTTLFAMVAGFLRPDAGRVAFDGSDSTGLRPHRICLRGIVRTFQVVQPFPTLSVRENVAVGAHARLRRRDAALARAGEIAEMVGMGEMLERPAGALTVAGRKRLELARALATGPRLLLLDEVMAGLNATEIDAIVDVVRRIREAGVTILLIEHVMRAVMRLSDRAYVLSNGSIIASGSPGEVASDPAVVEAYLGHGAARRMRGEGGGGDA
jgi:branched-chain amino acid transport system ATP-binding protein